MTPCLPVSEALAFSRNRHDAPGGDFGRSLNQGLLMIAAFRELRDDLSRGPTGLVPWAVAGTRYLRTDLSLTDILDLLLSAPAIDPDRIRNRVVSGHGATIGGRSVVLLGADAQATFRDLARDAVLGGLTRSPPAIPLRVPCRKYPGRMRAPTSTFERFLVCSGVEHGSTIELKANDPSVQGIELDRVVAYADELTKNLAHL